MSNFILKLDVLASSHIEETMKEYHNKEDFIISA